MTREEVLEIDAYCREHKVSYRQRLEELDIPFWNFYKAKKKYRLQEEAAADGNMPGGFVQPAQASDEARGKNPMKTKNVFAIKKESLSLQHDSMSTVRDKRLTHVEKP